MDPLDLTKSPGLGVCDRCETILELGWFGMYWLCEECSTHAVTCIGIDATGRAIERLKQLLEQIKQENEQLRQESERAKQGTPSAA